MCNYPRANCLCVPIILDIPRRGRDNRPRALRHYSLPPSLSLLRVRAREFLCRPQLTATPRRATRSGVAEVGKACNFCIPRSISASLSFSLVRSLSRSDRSPIIGAAEFANATRDLAAPFLKRGLVGGEPRSNSWLPRFLARRRGGEGRGEGSLARDSSRRTTRAEDASGGKEGAEREGRGAVYRL